MRLLLDTHLLLWAAKGAGMPRRAAELIEDEANELCFSVVSVWEVAIKSGKGRADFELDAGVFRRSLLDNAYSEIAVTGPHAAAVARLPPIHRDPFDRLLISQATVEGVTLLTADKEMARYGGPVRPI